MREKVESTKITENRTSSCLYTQLVITAGAQLSSDATGVSASSLERLQFVVDNSDFCNSLHANSENPRVLMG